jgi:hypothetical protein
MITVSEKANRNYLCKIVKLENIRKHSNADRLQIVSIDFQDVITGMDAKEGDIYIYFPVESKINSDFLSHTCSFRDKELNTDPEKTGFFEKNCRVKAVRLRGEKSMGYIVPAMVVFEWAKIALPEPVVYIGEEFDTINGLKLVEKYFVPKQGNLTAKQGKTRALSRLIDGQVHLHVDTDNLRKEIGRISPEDRISITYKTHGTSWWAGNLLVKRKLSLFERFLKFCGVRVAEQEYDVVYGSRKVVKNKSFEDPKGQDHFYGYDLWKDIKEEVKDHIPKGYTLYGECLGFTKDNSYIQKPYDYGCSPGKFKLEVYRITHTTPDGLVTELSYPEIKEFCEHANLTPSHLFYYGEAKNFLKDEIETGKYLHIEDIREWRAVFMKTLEMEYNEKDCFMCTNKVPEEGIVLRKESLFNCEPFKLKSFNFLEHESKQLDSGEANIEDNA